MEAARYHLSSLDLEDQVGAAWPHQQRDFLQCCIQLLKTTRDLRLQGEHFPNSQQFINDFCSDASAFLEMMASWMCDWRIAYAAVYLAAAGLYVHPDLAQVEVAGVPGEAPRARASRLRQQAQVCTW
jgi:hypothetical protein